jgi:hypothetical protein
MGISRVCRRIVKSTHRKPHGLNRFESKDRRSFHLFRPDLNLYAESHPKSEAEVLEQVALTRTIEAISQNPKAESLNFYQLDWTKDILLDFRI